MKRKKDNDSSFVGAMSGGLNDVLGVLLELKEQEETKEKEIDENIRKGGYQGSGEDYNREAAELREKYPEQMRLSTHILDRYCTALRDARMEMGLLLAALPHSLYKFLIVTIRAQEHIAHSFFDRVEQERNDPPPAAPKAKKTPEENQK